MSPVHSTRLPPPLPAVEPLSPYIMKTKPWWSIVLMAGAFTTAAPAAGDAPKGSTEATPKPAKKAAQKLSPPVAAKKATEEAKRVHVQGDLVAMSTPPPPARAETKTSAAATGQVWVPGHWAPVKGEWQWTPGQWQIPPTPVSVWIDSKYDAKTKQWSAGYWQPDRPESYESETAQQSPTPSPAKSEN